MAGSTVKTVEDYLDALTPERKEMLSTLREVILKNLPEGYEEGIQYGMISYFIPLEHYPKTYNKQPLAYVSLASQKQYVSLYLNCVYADDELENQFRSEWEATGKKLNMGKSCVRFKALDDVPLDVIGRSIASTSVDEYIAMYERSRSK